MLKCYVLNDHVIMTPDSFKQISMLSHIVTGRGLNWNKKGKFSSRDSTIRECFVNT